MSLINDFGATIMIQPYISFKKTLCSSKYDKLKTLNSASTLLSSFPIFQRILMITV